MTLLFHFVPQDVWKRVDKLYLDRTFNGQDWFALRQAALKKKIKTSQDAYDAIKVVILDYRAIKQAGTGLPTACARCLVTLCRKCWLRWGTHTRASSLLHSTILFTA